MHGAHPRLVGWVDTVGQSRKLFRVVVGPSLGKFEDSKHNPLWVAGTKPFSMESCKQDPGRQRGVRRLCRPALTKQLNGVAVPGSCATGHGQAMAGPSHDQVMVINHEPRGESHIRVRSSAIRLSIDLCIIFRKSKVMVRGWLVCRATGLQGPH